MEDALLESDKFAINEDMVQKKVFDIIETHLKNNDYHEDKVAQWVSNICEDTVMELYITHKPFKYMVSCVIMQKTGAALHSAHATHWDTAEDTGICILWPKRNALKDPANRMLCVVTVFAVCLSSSVKDKEK